MRISSSSLLVVLLAVVSPCHAQTVINQTNAGTGIGGGDTPGFPVTITVPGSYVLGTNLSPPTGVDAIDITASNVTVDLNGFTIGGYQPCSLASGGNWWTCTTGLYGVGIKSTADQTTIRNGNVKGFTTGISLSGKANRVSHVGLQTNATGLTNSGFGDLVDNVRAMRNGAGIIVNGQQAGVRDSSVSFNGGYGLKMSAGSVASGITATTNRLDGINFKTAATGQFLVSSYNGGAGISSGGTTVLSNTLTTENTGPGIQTTGRNTLRSAMATGNLGVGYSLSANTCYYHIGSLGNTGGDLTGGTSFTAITCF